VDGAVRDLGSVEFVDFNGFLQEGHGEEPAECGRLRIAVSTLPRYASEESRIRGLLFWLLGQRRRVLSVHGVQWLSERAVPQEEMERDRRTVVFCQVGWDAIHGHVATNPNPACPGLDGVEDIAAG
jgi:hypothetical protein